jgi:hypothetical protein
VPTVVQQLQYQYKVDLNFKEMINNILKNGYVKHWTKEETKKFTSKIIPTIAPLIFWIYCLEDRWFDR